MVLLSVAGPLDNAYLNKFIVLLLLGIGYVGSVLLRKFKKKP
jgi:hypothetical protein